MDSFLKHYQEFHKKFQMEISVSHKELWGEVGRIKGILTKNGSGRNSDRNRSSSHPRPVKSQESNLISQSQPNLQENALSPPVKSNNLISNPISQNPLRPTYEKPKSPMKKGPSSKHMIPQKPKTIPQSFQTEVQKHDSQTEFSPTNEIKSPNSNITSNPWSKPQEDPEQTNNLGSIGNIEKERLQDTQPTDFPVQEIEERQNENNIECKEIIEDTPTGIPQQNVFGKPIRGGAKPVIGQRTRSGQSGQSVVNTETNPNNEVNPDNHEIPLNEAKVITKPPARFTPPTRGRGGPPRGRGGAIPPRVVPRIGNTPGSS